MYGTGWRMYGNAWRICSRLHPAARSLEAQRTRHKGECKVQRGMQVQERVKGMHCPPAAVHVATTTLKRFSSWGEGSL